MPVRLKVLPFNACEIVPSRMSEESFRVREVTPEVSNKLEFHVTLADFYVNDFSELLAETHIAV